MVWTRQDGSQVIATTGSSLLLNFNPLRASHGNNYTCTATVDIHSVVKVSGEESVDIIVPSK